MANTLILNQNQVFNGLGTLTYTVAAAGQFNVQVQVTFPQADAIVRLNNNSPGIAGLSGNVNLGAGSGAGLGAGRGDQTDTDFCGGDLGTGQGGSGRGFQSQVDYPQPPSAGSNLSIQSPTTSSLAIVVKNGVSTIYTATTPAVAQSALQFKYSFLASLADVITVVLSSSASVDNQLSGITSNVSISQGLL